MNLIKPTKTGVVISYPKDLVAKIFTASIEKTETTWKVTKVIWGKGGLKLICKTPLKKK